ncbi:MAG: FAD-dependent monooxygenase [Deltaproteobacteria bacterium]|nr:FAD-dependent monooxygenase [Deltaproteobacteria bacterium]
MALPDRADVAVVGAGSAGAAAAALCARQGLRVVCVDRRSLVDAGAHWVNGVPARDFDEAGFERPRGDELLGSGSKFHLIAGRGPRRITLEGHGVLEVDMRKLVDRLQREAREAGVELVGDVEVGGYRDGNLVTNRGSLNADIVVDASGLAGPRLLGTPSVRPQDLCTAAQQVREVSDWNAACEFFARHQCERGDVACFTAIAGGYSILNVRLHGDTVSILTGSIPGPDRPSGQRILDDFVREQAWIGAKVFGGSRAIPIRRPFDRIAGDRVAAIGDAAAQVFPAHGSGIGAGLIAAGYLAKAVAAGKRPHTYAFRWQRDKGGLFASFDLFRRFSSTLTADQLAWMMDSGVMDPELARAGLAQEFPRPTPRNLAGKLPALSGHPRLASRMATMVAKMIATRALYARYPSRPETLPAWSRRIARVFGDPPDLPG